MSCRKLLRVALFISLGLFAAGLYGSAAEEASSQKRILRKRNAEARRDTAKKAYERASEGPVRGDVGYLWSVRWLQAEPDLSLSNDDRVAASEAHLKRMKDWMKRTQGEGAVNVNAVLGAKFYVLEAEDWLMTAQGEE